jgi:hypothetical protein
LSREAGRSLEFGCRKLAVMVEVQGIHHHTRLLPVVALRAGQEDA